MVLYVFYFPVFYPFILLFLSCLDNKPMSGLITLQLTFDLKFYKRRVAKIKSPV